MTASGGRQTGDRAERPSALDRTSSSSAASPAASDRVEQPSALDRTPGPSAASLADGDRAERPSALDRTSSPSAQFGKLTIAGSRRSSGPAIRPRPSRTSISIHTSMPANKAADARWRPSKTSASIHAPTPTVTKRCWLLSSIPKPRPGYVFVNANCECAPVDRREVLFRGGQ
jgi:hypothetical protein